MQTHGAGAYFKQIVVRAACRDFKQQKGFANGFGCGRGANRLFGPHLNAFIMGRVNALVSLAKVMGLKPIRVTFAAPNYLLRFMVGGVSGNSKAYE